MISATSRYANAVIDTATGPTGDTRQEMRVPFPRSRQITFTYHRVTGVERVDVIAYNYYGNARLWWRIADANPEIMDWLALEPGEVIRVPSA